MRSRRTSAIAAKQSPRLRHWGSRRVGERRGAARRYERQISGAQSGEAYDGCGSTAGTPGSDRLARDLPFAVARKSADGRVHPDPAMSGHW
jgi:hypothetical protein